MGAKQFTAKSTNTEKTKKDQYKSYVGEPLPKFKARIKGDGADLSLYEITNADVDIDPEGYIIISQIMDLVEKLKGSVTNTQRIVQIASGLDLLKKEGEEKEKKQAEAEKEKAGEGSTPPPSGDSSGST